MKNFKRSLRTVFTLAASAVMFTGSGDVFACQQMAGTSDTVLNHTFPFPTAFSARSFVMRQAEDFDIPDFSWHDHGLEAYDDPHFEYAKHWMSSYVVAFSHEFEHRVTGTDSSGQHVDLLLDRAFHTNQDYYNMAKGEPTFGPVDLFSLWHGQFLSILGGDDDVKLGEFLWSEHPPVSAAIFWPLALFPEHTETVTTFCGLYDVQAQGFLPAPDDGGPPSRIFLPDTPNVYGTPSERASDLVHEGMHAHYRDVDALDHVSCTKGTRDESGGCDLFYSHLKKDYAGDDLWRADSGSHKIPAYEIQLEFLCDLVDEARDWMPLALLSDAEGTADRTGKTHFVAPGGFVVIPPYDCGVPSPMMEERPPAGCDASQCGGKKDGTACSDGVCVGGCCQVIK